MSRNAALIRPFLPILLYGALVATEAVAQADRQVPARMERTIQKSVSTPYLLYLPAGYEASRDDWPLLLFLHGSGERGTDLNSVKVHGPPKLISQGHAFPFIVVSPQCPAGEWWSEDTLVALLDEIVEAHRVDEDRVYVTGLSMGGYGAWRLADRIPDRLAAIVPICGGGTPEMSARIKDIPAWVFHGAEDEAVDLSESAKMVNALYEAGGAPRFTVYPEAGHVEAWQKAYADPALWSWLLEQRR